MESKINGCVYHRFINNYQKPLLATKIESINTPKRTINKRNTVDTFKSKIIYVNKKAGNIPLNQIDISSETKSITNTSERTLSSLRNANKSDKSSIKYLLNENTRLHILSNGLNLSQKTKKKNSQNNESNIFNSKLLFDEDVSNNFIKIKKIKNNKKNKIQLKNNTIHRLKKYNSNNINTDGNLDFINNISNINKMLNSNYINNNPDSKRKKNNSSNCDNEGNIKSSNLSNISIKGNKNKNDGYESVFNSNKTIEKKKNFIKENNDNKELSRLIQENYIFDFHRKFNNYTNFNNKNFLTINNSDNYTHNSIQRICNSTESYKRENSELRNELFNTSKTFDDKDRIDFTIKAEISPYNENKNQKNLILNNNIQKKRLKEFQLKLEATNKELRKMNEIKKYNSELEKKNESLSKMLSIVKNKNEIFISQIEELQNKNFDNVNKIQQLEAKLKLYKNDNIFEGKKIDNYNNFELKYRSLLEKNNKISNDYIQINKELKELKEIKNKYNILIKEHENSLKTELLFNELKIKYNVSQNNIKSLTNELNLIQKNLKKKKEEIDLLKIEKTVLKKEINIYGKNNEKLKKEINNLKIINLSLINNTNNNNNSNHIINNSDILVKNENNKKELNFYSSFHENQIIEINKNVPKMYEIQSNLNNISIITDKKNTLNISQDIHLEYINDIENNNNSFEGNNYSQEKNKVKKIKRKKNFSEEKSSSKKERKKSKLKKLKSEYKELNEKYNEINDKNIQLNNTVNELSNICNMNNSEMFQEILSIKELNNELLKNKQENENKVLIYEQKIDELNNELLLCKEKLLKYDEYNNELNKENNNENNSIKSNKDTKEENINDKYKENGSNTNIIINTVVKDLNNKEDNNKEIIDNNQNKENDKNNNENENKENNENNNSNKDNNEDKKSNEKIENEESLNWEDYNFDDEDIESSDNNNENNNKDNSKIKINELNISIENNNQSDENNKKDIIINNNIIKQEDNNNKDIKYEINDNIINENKVYSEDDNENKQEKKIKKKKKKGKKRKKVLELEEKISEKDNIIEEINLEYKNIQKELSDYKSEINSLQNYITQLEAGLDVNSQINNLKNIIYEKEQLLLTISDQIAEYQSQCDDIIMGKSTKEKEEQIKLLINEVKAIRNKIINLITFNKRISNFDEFINCVDIIEQLNNEKGENKIDDSVNNKIKIAFEKINYLINVYKQNNEDYYHKLIKEIFKIYENEEKKDIIEKKEEEENNINNNGNGNENENNNNNLEEVDKK